MPSKPAGITNPLKAGPFRSSLQLAGSLARLRVTDEPTDERRTDRHLLDPDVDTHVPRRRFDPAGVVLEVDEPEVDEPAERVCTETSASAPSLLRHEQERGDDGDQRRSRSRRPAARRCAVLAGGPTARSNSSPSCCSSAPKKPGWSRRHDQRRQLGEGARDVHAQLRPRCTRAGGATST